MSESNCENPCPQCPFARTTTKEYLDTKGENGERFIGQSVGPFSLPCHMTKKFGNWVEEFIMGGEIRPCMGARIYRANLGIGHFLPPQAHEPAFPDYEKVFGGHDELLAHHRGISIEEARKLLEATPPGEMCMKELGRQGGIVKMIRKE